MKRLLLITYLLGLGLFAQNKAYNPLTSNGQLYEFAQYAKAEQQEFSAQDIIADASLRFKNLESENHSVGFTQDHYWIKFSLENSSKAKETYYLETGRPITDVADLYQVSESDISVFKSGDQIPFSERQLEHRLTVFKIELKPNTTLDYYLHLKSDGETINIPLILYDETSFWIMNYKQQLFLGLFYGLLLLAGVIYLFFYTSLRDKTFLYYGFYVFSIGFMQAALDGFIYQYILPDGGYLNSRAVLITALLSNFFLLKYCEYFLNVSALLKPFKKVFKGVYLVLTILLIMTFISQDTLALVYSISNVNGLISLLLILVTVFTMKYKRISIDPYFSFGIFFLVVGLLGFVMNNLSLVPNNFYTLNSAKFGSGFEVVFLSLSMTNLLRKLRRDKEKSQEEALKKSEEISQLKTYFMSNISHELRTCSCMASCMICLVR
ncbi:7TM diverse intracellular signaling domain-containing protein [Psychroserpens sp. XS_ASV72]|uniref:7TMR-DISM family protein n=1 Tax=Psychroserpens sp. XS_ASV72 TaxID=3241293 RepID=UPI0035167DC3